MVEQGTHKPLVGGSNPPSATSSSEPPGRMSALADRMADACARLGVEDGIPIVLAVSGGPDSTALMHLAARLAPRGAWELHVAHLDHGLREASVDDARFVAGAAATLGLEPHQRRTDVAALAAEHGRGIEEAGRIARYAFFDELADDLGPRAVVMTAHTADDQAETSLLHLARGAGLAGLGGIAERRGRVVRPLLTLRRAELRAALDAEGITYLADPSNDDLRHARNRARRDLLPALERLHPGAAASLARSAALVADDDHALDAIAAATLAARRSADGWIDWRPAPAPAIGRRVLRLAAGSPAPSAERIGALLDAATSGRGGRTIELGGERRALLRGGRVQIVHSA